MFCVSHDLVVAQPPTYINGHLLLRIADHNGRSPVMLCFFHWKQRHLPIFHHVFFLGESPSCCLFDALNKVSPLPPSPNTWVHGLPGPHHLLALRILVTRIQRSCPGETIPLGGRGPRTCMHVEKMFFCIQHSHKIFTVQMWTYRMNCIHQTCPEHYMQIFTHIFKCIHPCIYAYVSRHAPLSFAGG